jgi:hypothetical protein
MSVLVFFLGLVSELRGLSCPRSTEAKGENHEVGDFEVVVALQLVRSEWMASTSVRFVYFVDGSRVPSGRPFGKIELEGTASGGDAVPFLASR